MTLITQQAGDSVHINADWNGSAYSNTSGQSQGILLEGPRTQMLADPEAPATQNVTVTAVEHTLSMTGTGSLTLSGVGSGTATEAAPLTFTPTAGTLTVTVDGSVQTAQLEIGHFKSSFFPTTGERAQTSLTALLSEIGFPSDRVNNISIKLKLRFSYDIDQERDSFQQVVVQLLSSTGAQAMRLFVPRSDDRIGSGKIIDGAAETTVYLLDVPTYSAGDVIQLSMRTSVATGFNACVNGGALTANLNGGDFGAPITNIIVGDDLSGTRGQFMTLEKIELFDRAITEEEMQAPL